jgi:hypothetical protein
MFNGIDARPWAPPEGGAAGVGLPGAVDQAPCARSTDGSTGRSGCWSGGGDTAPGRAGGTSAAWPGTCGCICRSSAETSAGRRYCPGSGRPVPDTGDMEPGTLARPPAAGGAEAGRDGTLARPGGAGEAHGDWWARGVC